MCDQCSSTQSVERTAGKETLRKSSKQIEPQITYANINIDHILENIVQPWGVWQWTVTLLMMFSTSSLATFPVYANSASPHRCRMEPLIESYIQEHNELAFDQIASRIGPWVGGDHIGLHYNQYGCYRYKLDWMNFTVSELDAVFNSTTSDTLLTVNVTEPCPFGYVHEVSPKHYPQNVVIEYETVCARAWLVPFGTSVFMCGMSLGFMLGGWCAGRFGRRRTILMCALCEFFCALWTSLSPNYISYILSRGATAVCATAKNSVAGVLIIELTVARYRSLFKAVLALGIAFFYRALLALWAYYVPNWRWLNVVAMSPNLLSLLHICFLPESPRWLVAKHRTEDAIEVLRTGYRINHRLRKTRADFDLLMQQCTQATELKPDPNIHLGTESAPKRTQNRTKLYLIKTTVNCVLAMFGITMCFTGILFYARIVRDYVYLVGFLNSLMALPGTVLFMLLYRYCARRKLPIMILCGLAAIVLAISASFTMVVKPETDIVLTAGSNIAFVFILASLCMGNMYVPELYPSIWRTQGLGFVMGLARVGGILCTFVNELDGILLHGTPMLIYSGLLAFVVLALWFLDDTKGEDLPDR